MKAINLRFDGKTAVVFGGSRGIGKAIVDGLAEGGAKVVYIGDLLKEDAQQTADALNKAGYKVVVEKVDVRDYDQVEKLLQRAKKETGQLDIVVNNAGIVGTTPFLEATTEEIKNLIDVNVMGVNNGCQAALKVMIPNEGKIVNTSSFVGHHAMREGFPHYGMSKTCVIYLTQAAAYAGAPYNINVNAICPGIIRTLMWEEVLDDMTKGVTKDRAAAREAKWKENVEHFIPLKRGAQTSEDIAYATLFLCTPYADQITGQELNVDGGAAMT